jgi:serine/threonine-protein kinase
LTPERWSRVKDVFHGAVDLRLDERAAYLESVCGADAELRREVESLVGFDAPSADEGLPQSPTPDPPRDDR